MDMYIFHPKKEPESSSPSPSVFRGCGQGTLPAKIPRGGTGCDPGFPHSVPEPEPPATEG